MISILHIQILTKIGETILQSRLNAKKSLFLKFQELLNYLETNNGAIFNRKLNLFLDSILIKQQYKIKSKIQQRLNNKLNNKKICLQINFSLIDRKSGIRAETQLWDIKYQVKSDIDDQQFILVTFIFKEIIRALNKIPMFSIYLKDSELKAKYIFDYEIKFDDIIKNKSIVERKTITLIERFNESFQLKIELYYFPSLQHLKQKSPLLQKPNRRQSVAISEDDGERRVSVYAFYDPDLDFTFLSSDDQSFKKKGNQITEQIQMQLQSQQFQLLMISQDEDFIADNKEFFQSFAGLEKMYIS